jgi:hypothetical protein
MPYARGPQALQLAVPQVPDQPPAQRLGAPPLFDTSSLTVPDHYNESL